MPPGLSTADLGYLLPEIVLAAGALLLIVADVLLPRAREGVMAWLALTVLAATAAAVFLLAGVTTTVSRGLLAIDGFSTFFKTIFLGAAAFVVLLSRRYLEVERVGAGAYYVLLLCATLGMMIMASGIELITLFVGLETMALAFYVLAGYLKPDRRSNEAAVKYFVLGAFSLGILLYGMSLLYALAGTTHLRDLAVALAGTDRPLALTLAVLLVAAGLAFKIAAVPFHMWAPDVYEGSPTPVTAFLSVGSKAASFAMLLRIFIEGVPSVAPHWTQVFYILAVLTMTVGNVAALTQSNIKRMLAYSSIAHAGYVLIGVVSATPRGVTATLLYLFIYAFMQLGAFAVVVLLRRHDAIGDELKDLSGLYLRSPLAACAMLVFMLSLGGIPPTAGFMAKLWIFSAAIEAGYVWLAVIGVLNSALSLYYYVRVVVFMWVKEPAVGSAIVPHPSLRVALAVAVSGTLLIGVYPGPLFDFAERSARMLGAAPPPALTIR
jgi:NADH-quinone oxidoreductase subunit N